MKRKIIKINEEKCTGCGLCIPNCPEGALQIIDGKARLISDLFCDGLGACIGHCPEGAILIEDREAEPYDEGKVMENIIKAGPNTIKAHLEHLCDHGEDDLYEQAIQVLKEKNIPIPEMKEESSCGCSHESHHSCPGAAEKTIEPKSTSEQTTGILTAELKNWPVQLQLMNPGAGYFKNADLLITADCVPFAYPNFHKRFLKDKILIMFCPKLDQAIESYLDKLEYIFSNHDIKSISLVHMEVPCCFGLNHIVIEALKRSGKNIIIKEYTIGINGEIL